MLKPEQVADYLKQNPAFIDSHLDLIVGETSDDSMPFHERQLNVLRERHAAQVARYEQVVDSARSNQDLEKSLHDLAISLLAATTRDSEAAIRILCTHFDLARARVISPQQDGGTEDQTADGSADMGDIALLRKRVAHGSSICDDRVSSELLTVLFENNHDVGSCAFIPLGETDSVLVLGAREADRFQPGMGPIYLDRIGALLAAFLGEV